MDAFFGSKPTKGDDQKDHSKPSNSDLFSSAKLIAEAAKSSFSNQSDNVDKAKLAGAAENLLNAAEEYGKLDEKGYGTYVDKAEDYLHKYSTPTTTAPPAAAPPDPAPAPAPAPAPHDSEEDKPAGIGGVGDVMKIAGGFFK